jgi:hypothetical protein
MITENLFDQILINPIKQQCNRLYIVSGYASATFARRHIQKILDENEDIEINLIIGMPTKKADHLAFVSLHKEFHGKFKGYYVVSNPPVHAKVYSWFNNEVPVIGYSGSANYSQYGFFEDQQNNQFSSENPVTIKQYYDAILSRSKPIPDLVVKFALPNNNVNYPGSVPPGMIRWDIPDQKVTISFLDRRGNLPAISGLNWGQRLGKAKNRVTGAVSYTQREPNQAYLSLKQDARKLGFLPPQAYTFSLVTDDGYSFDCVVAQEGRKAIQSTNNNSLLGEYFRNRMGLPLGSLITLEDLENYGRTDYTIEKRDDETFELNFSV